MVEFRGASAVAAVAALGVFAMIMGGLAYWWMSRHPSVSPPFSRPLRQRFWWSWALGLLIMVGLWAYAVVWFPSN